MCWLEFVSFRPRKYNSPEEQKEKEAAASHGMRKDLGDVV